MNLAIVSANAHGDIEPIVLANLIGHLPNQIGVAAADVIILCVSWQPNFKFDVNLREIEKKPIVLLDFAEFGWNAGNQNNLWGTGMTHQFGHLHTPEYARFDDWVRNNPPRLEFKRELLQRDCTPTRLPVEWPCALPALPLHTKEEFDARPIECFSCWGMSNPSRPRLHGDIFRNAHDFGITFIDDFRDEGHFEKRTWVSIYSPHWRRIHINEIMRWQRRAKISVSLPGAGVKCFRSTMEAPVGSIVAMPQDQLVWSYDWIDGVNCIRLRPNHLFEDLQEATHRLDLWEIYRACQDTVENYRSQRYIDNYIIPSIVSIL